MTALPNFDHADTSSTAEQATYFGGLAEQADFLRKIAKSAADETVNAVVAEFFRDIDGEEPDEDVAVLRWNRDHPGAAPIRWDADAKVLAQKIAQNALRDAGYPDDNIVFCGEEGGSGTHLLRAGNIIVRQDVLDGSKLAQRVMSDFSSVHLIDMVRPDRARHMGGAIACANGLTVSWANHSRFNGRDLWYPRPEGMIYLDGHRWAQPERRVRGLSYDRHAGTIAAVAAVPEKKEQLDRILTQLDVTPNAIFTVGGTPLVAALIAGSISMLVEPNPVSLHDSALLLPFQLLGGHITDIEGNSLDYIRLYEQHATELEATDKPIPGYIAWAGPQNLRRHTPIRKG